MEPLAVRRRGIVGPEPWRADWSYLDMWYAVVCVADCNGDLDVLDGRSPSRISTTGTLARRSKDRKSVV